MSTPRDKTMKIVVPSTDRYLVRRRFPDAPAHVVEMRAAARAIGRQVLNDCGSTLDALDTVTAEVPAPTLRAWMERRWIIPDSTRGGR